MKELDAQVLAESYRVEEGGVELEVSLPGTGELGSQDTPRPAMAQYTPPDPRPQGHSGMRRTRFFFCNRTMSTISGMGLSQTGTLVPHPL